MWMLQHGVFPPGVLVHAMLTGPGAFIRSGVAIVCGVILIFIVWCIWTWPGRQGKNSHHPIPKVLKMIYYFLREGHVDLWSRRGLPLSSLRSRNNWCETEATEIGGGSDGSLGDNNNNKKSLPSVNNENICAVVQSRIELETFCEQRCETEIITTRPLNRFMKKFSVTVTLLVQNNLIQPSSWKDEEIWKSLPFLLSSFDERKLVDGKIIGILLMLN